MHIIHIDHLAINYAGREIFRDLTWAISDRERTGLVGPNGAGKSSLLRAIAGVVTPEAGRVVRASGISIGYLHQDVKLPAGSTLIEAASTLPPALAETEAQLAQLETRLADPAVYNEMDVLQSVLAEQDTVLTRYERLNGPRHASLVRELLAMLGFTANDYDLPVASLSGGQKKMVALVQLAVESPDLLLLDEPDNHLDIAAKRHLERFIRQYPGAVLLVSHDRYLLDEVATHIAELENARLTVYTGNYTAYTTERELQRLRQQQQYTTQQKQIAQIEAAIARFELWASMVVDERHIRQARSRRKMLERMEERGEIIEKVHEQRLMEFQLNGGRGSTKSVELNGVTMGFDDDLLFLDVDFLLRHGERVGLVGPNGAGKSVLFKLILNQLQPLAGEVKVGPSTQMGYYSQEHQTLNRWLDRTPLDMVRDERVISEGAAVTFLLKMAFSYEQVRQPVRTLSGGERSRLQLAMLMLQQPNVLLLDEPTNNLDIQSVEVLEAALDEFEGAVLVISHDRYFLDRVVDRVVALEDGGLTDYPGGYTDYLDSSGR